MNVLLIYPKYPDTFWSFKHALRFIGKKAVFAPLCLLTVASMLPKAWNLRLADTNVRKLTDKQIKWADMIFISAMLVQKNSAKEIIARCKRFNKIVVAGGPAFTAEHEKFEGVDHFVLKEAEITLPLFLTDLENDKAKKIYTSEEKPDLKTTPIPDWSLIRFKDYVSMAIQFSRGCPFDCEFCDITPSFGNKPRTKSPEQLIAEIQSLYDAGWRGGLFIVDDNFIGNKVKSKEMLRALIDWQKKHAHPFVLFTEASINLAKDEELMQLMRDANFNRVFVGVETTNLASLNACGKTQNVNTDLTADVKTIQEHGIQVMAGFIVGFDQDDKSVFRSMPEFIQNTKIATAMVGILGAIPNTKLWKRLEKEGRLTTDTTRGDNTAGGINFSPKMDINTLLEGYRTMVNKLYSPKVYYNRVYAFLKDFKPTAREKISLSGIKALFKSIWLIGIFSRSSPHYWKLVFKTLLTKPRLLPMAIEMAICGWHFKKVAEKISHN